MNYLAHAYLSFNQPQVLVGNMISDYVKGKKQYDYGPAILKGIKLHRYIDQFTDDHPITKEMKQIFRPTYGLYAGAFIDIVYDYFLANDKTAFHSGDHLIEFAENIYSILEKNINATPPVFQRLFPYMKTHDWLSNYQYQWAIQKSFSGMAHRAKYITETDTAFAIFKENIPFLEPYYNEFFPRLKEYAFQTFQDLLNND